MNALYIHAPEATKDYSVFLYSNSSRPLSITKQYGILSTYFVLGTKPICGGNFFGARPLGQLGDSAASWIIASPVEPYMRISSHAKKYA